MVVLPPYIAFQVVVVTAVAYPKQIIPSNGGIFAVYNSQSNLQDTQTPNPIKSSLKSKMKFTLLLTQVAVLIAVVSANGAPSANVVVSKNAAASKEGAASTNGGALPILGPGTPLACKIVTTTLNGLCVLANYDGCEATTAYVQCICQAQNNPAKVLACARNISGLLKGYCGK
ncbi:hypothetical protein BGX26_003619 [Mortierella sp. AD094]|nr:hypothetical protein BGX26_003619 [Mortierella sp. AD094]